jgi:hypothetical protein
VYRKFLLSFARIVGVLVVIAALTYFVGSLFYSSPPKSQLALGEIFAAVDPLLVELREAAENQGSLPGIGKLVHAPTSVPTHYGTANVLVSNDGKITVYHAALQFTVTFSPAMIDDNFTWKCTGTGIPDRYLPKWCAAA